jgi:hypothetical protein
VEDLRDRMYAVAEIVVHEFSKRRKAGKGH